MKIDDIKPRIETLKRMLAVGKTLVKNENSEIYELGHYIADNVLTKLCMLVGIEKNRPDLVYLNKNKTRTKDFKQLYEGILLNFYPSVPKYDEFAQKYHRDRNIYQHSLEHLDIKTIKKPVAKEYLKFAEKIIKTVGYLGKSEEIQPTSIGISYSYNLGDHQKNYLTQKFKKFYDRLSSDDREHIHIDMKTILNEIGNTNFQKILKMEYRNLRYGDSMLIEHDNWNLNLNHTFHKYLSISKQGGGGTYHFSEPTKSPEILQEFLDMIKERCKDAGLDIS